MVKDKFWQNLGKRTPFPSSDLYSNVKLRKRSKPETEAEPGDGDKSDKSFVKTEETWSRRKSRQGDQPRVTRSKSSKKSDKGNVAASLSISGYSTRALGNGGTSYAFALWNDSHNA